MPTMSSPVSSTRRPAVRQARSSFPERPRKPRVRRDRRNHRGIRIRQQPHELVRIGPVGQQFKPSGRIHDILKRSPSRSKSALIRFKKASRIQQFFLSDEPDPVVVLDDLYPLPREELPGLSDVPGNDDLNFRWDFYGFHRILRWTALLKFYEEFHRKCQLNFDRYR